jgi:hypothetical protein
MPGRQAKTLSAADVADLLVFASCTRNPLRNSVIVLLSAKAGLRAGEIANLTWDMVVDANGQISGLIELADAAAKKCSGRSIPVHPDLAAALTAWRQVSPSSDYMIASERGGRMNPLSIVVWFNRAFQEYWPQRLLVTFRPPDVRHPGRPHRSQSRRLAAGRATAGRPPVDPNDAALHRWRQRRPAEAGFHDLNGHGDGDHSFTSPSDQPPKSSQNSERARFGNRPRCPDHPRDLRPRRVSNMD